MLNLHRIACDEWSLSLLCDQLSALYRERVSGLVAELAPLSVPYEDLAGPRQRAGGEAYGLALAYWTKHLAGAPGMLTVPTDRPRPTVRSYRGARVTTVLSKEFVADLEAFAASRGFTVFIVLLSAFSGLLGRLAGQDDVVIGTPVPGHRHEDP